MSGPVDVTNSNWAYKGHVVHCIRRDPSAGDAVQPQRQKVAPAILLVHGFGASTHHWRHNIPVLSRTHEVHALDLLGFGKSAKPAELNYGGALWRDQVVAYVKEQMNEEKKLVKHHI